MSLLTDTTQRCRKACLCVHVCVRRLETKSNNSTFHPLNFISETFFFFYSSAQAASVRHPRVASPDWPGPGTSNNLLFLYCIHLFIHPSSTTSGQCSTHCQCSNQRSLTAWSNRCRSWRSAQRHSIQPGEPVHSITHFIMWPKTVQVQFGSKLTWWWFSLLLFII